MHNYKSLKLTILVLLLISITIFAGCGGGTTPPINQYGTAEGFVKDAVTRTGIEEAIVTIGDKTNITNSDGAYEIINIPVGSYPFTIIVSGYESYSSTIVINEGTNTIPDVFLASVALVALEIYDGFTDAAGTLTFYSEKLSADVEIIVETKARSRLSEMKVNWLVDEEMIRVGIIDPNDEYFPAVYLAPIEDLKSLSPGEEITLGTWSDVGGLGISITLKKLIDATGKIIFKIAANVVAFISGSSAALELSSSVGYNIANWDWSKYTIENMLENGIYLGTWSLADVRDERSALNIGSAICVFTGAGTVISAMFTAGSVLIDIADILGVDINQKYEVYKVWWSVGLPIGGYIFKPVVATPVVATPVIPIVVEHGFVYSAGDWVEENYALGRDQTWEKYLADPGIYDSPGSVGQVGVVQCWYDEDHDRYIWTFTNIGFHFFGRYTLDNIEGYTQAKIKASIATIATIITYDPLDFYEWYPFFLEIYINGIKAGETLITLSDGWYECVIPLAFSALATGTDVMVEFTSNRLKVVNPIPETPFFSGGEDMPRLFGDSAVILNIFLILE